MMQSNHPLPPSSLIFIVFCLLSTMTFAQIGFTGAYYKQQVPGWEAAVFQNQANGNLLSKGYSFGLDYWLKPLKNYRVELFPELVIGSSKSDITRNALPESFKLRTVGFNLNTNIYLLKIESDCNCPTFSKPDSFFKKGFFIQVSPGIHYLNGAYVYAGGTQKNTVTNTLPKLGIGVGVDIGISDFITLTPIIKYNRFFKAKWAGLTELVNESNANVVEGNDESKISQFYVGLHIGIR